MGTRCVPVVALGGVRVALRWLGVTPTQGGGPSPAPSLGGGKEGGLGDTLVALLLGWGGGEDDGPVALSPPPPCPSSVLPGGGPVPHWG